MSADFDKIRALCDAATPAPWRVESGGGHAYPRIVGSDLAPTATNGNCPGAYSFSATVCETPHSLDLAAPRATMDLIVALRNAVPEILALTADRDALAALLKEARPYVDEMANWTDDSDNSHYAADPTATEPAKALLARIDAASGGKA